MKEKIINFIYIFLPLILGSFIGLLIHDYSYYDTLSKPILAPSEIVFPIVWSIIYILMGLSYYLYRKKESNVNILYYFQLVVNLLWTIIFFLLKSNILALLWIILLDVLIILNIINYYKYNKISAYLFIPYLIWSLFATYLTISINILN
mgnify:FL=1